MYLSVARQLVREAARNGQTPNPYALVNLDHAIYASSTDCLKRLRCLKQTADVSLTADTWDYPDITDFPADFRPEMVLGVSLVNATGDPPTTMWTRAVQKVDWEQIWQMHSGGCTRTGPPTHVGWDQWDHLGVYPTPDADYSLHARHYLPETTWTYGRRLMPVATATVLAGAVTAVTITRGGGEFGVGVSAPTISFSGGGGSGATATSALDTFSNYVTSATVTGAGSAYATPPTVAFAGTAAGTLDDFQLRIPDDLAMDVLQTAAAARLMGSTPESQKIVADYLARYEAFMKQQAGIAGNLGASVILRESVRSRLAPVEWR